MRSFSARVAASAALQGCRYLPRMDRQPSIRPYEQRMPATPPGSVPRRGAEPMRTGPQAPSEKGLAYGKLYYGYYCAMCHGSDGRGHAPVGESYHPAPKDLGSAEVQAKSDEGLCRTMVAGTGHEPTLGYIVPPERRWLIAHHLRTLPMAQGRDPSPESGR